MCIVTGVIIASAALADDYFSSCGQSHSVVAERYFPPHTIGEKSESFREKWYSTCLAAARERPLFASPQADEAYRFFWLGGFRRTVVLRAERSGKEYRLIIKEIFVRPVKDHGEDDVVENGIRFLTESEWNDLKTLLSNASFWDLPTQANECQTCRDGTRWVLEGFQDAQYHVVDRSSPRDLAKPFREACLYLWKLSGLEPIDAEY